jgi:hypothetical protein
MKIDGGCHCGYIAYEAEADPAKARICHCTDCQTLSGSAFRTVLPTQEGSFKLRSDTMAIRAYCSSCASRKHQAERPEKILPQFLLPCFETAASRLHFLPPTLATMHVRFLPVAKQARTAGVPHGAVADFAKGAKYVANVFVKLFKLRCKNVPGGGINHHPLPLS